MMIERPEQHQKLVDATQAMMAIHPDIDTQIMTLIHVLAGVIRATRKPQQKLMEVVEALVWVTEQD